MRTREDDLNELERLARELAMARAAREQAENSKRLADEQIERLLGQLAIQGEARQAAEAGCEELAMRLDKSRTYEDAMRSERDTALARAAEHEQRWLLAERDGMAAETALATALAFLERLRDTPPARRNAWLQALRSEVTTWLASHPAPVAEYERKPTQGPDARYDIAPVAAQCAQCDSQWHEGYEAGAADVRRAAAPCAGCAALREKLERARTELETPDFDFKRIQRALEALL